MISITIIDYKTSNIKSVENILLKIGAKPVITSDPELVLMAEKIILPGVGSFDVAIKNLMSLGLVDVLDEVVNDKRIPILGICLGMQLFANSSDEGVLPGLGWIPGIVKKFDSLTADQFYPIPHMGWNYVNPTSDNQELFKNIPDPMRFYFVHSYYFKSESRTDVISETNYIRNFDSAVKKDNIWGVQFHPEKSHNYGMQLMRNFVENV